MAKKTKKNKITKHLKKLKTYTIVSDYDGNDNFEVEALNDNDAAHEALNELGWWVAANKPE